MSYCEFCGEEIKSGEKCNCPQAQKKATKSPLEKKSKLIGIILACSLILIVLIACLTNFSSKKDPFEYVEVSFSGVNTLGQANVRFNESELIMSIIGEEPSVIDSTEGAKEFLEWSQMYEEYQLAIELTVSKEENLSNGEEITVTITASGVATDKISSGEKSYAVSGLKDFEKVDIFKDVEVSFEGIDGEGTITIKNNSSDAFVSKIDFYIDSEKSTGSNYSLLNGDVVTVAARYDENLIIEHSSIPMQITKNYTVSNLAKVVGAEDLSSEFINQLKQVAYEILLADEKQSANEYDYNNIKYECTYFYDNENKNTYYTPDNPKKELVAFYSLERTDLRDGNKVKTVYCGISFSSLAGDMILSPDGTYKILSRGREYAFDTEIGERTRWKDSLEDAITNIYPLFEDETYYTRTKVD